MKNLGPKIAMLDRQKDLEEQFRNLNERKEKVQRVIDQHRYLNVLQILGVNVDADTDLAFSGIGSDSTTHPMMVSLNDRKKELNKQIKGFNKEIEDFKSSLDEATKLRIEKRKSGSGEDEQDQ